MTYLKENNMIYSFKQWTPKLGINIWIAPSADVVGNDISR